MMKEAEAEHVIASLRPSSPSVPHDSNSNSNSASMDISSPSLSSSLLPSGSSLSPALGPQLAVAKIPSAFITSPINLSQQQQQQVPASLRALGQIGGTLAVSQPRRQVTHKVDLLATDFFGPADAIKGLFALPYAKADQTFALHKCGNTLLVDTLANDVFGELEEHVPVHERTITTEGLLHDLATVLSPTAAHSAKGEQHQFGADSDYDGDEAAVVAEEMEEDAELNVSLPLSCPLTPPPAFYVPATPQPPSAILQWQFREMQLVLGSSLPVYRTDLHPALSVRAHDTTKQLQLHTCLDYYLDNVMANVPELALCMHAKGFIRGWKILPTEEIPNLNGSTRDGLATANTPMFDPSVVDFNATMLLRFLKEHCQADEGTYLLRKTTQNETVHLYDLTALSASRTKKWKWLLAMLSYRFAVRMAHHMDEVTANSRSHLLHRQRRLLNICLELLHQLTELGSETHETIEAAVLEHLANTHLVHRPSEDDDSDWHSSKNREVSMEDLDAADEYLARAVQVIETMVNKFRKREKHDADDRRGEAQRDEEGDGDEDEEDYVEEMISMQLSGIVYKRVSVATRMIRFYLSLSQPQVGLQKLLRVVDSLRLWADVVRRTDQEAGSASLRDALSDLTQHIWALLGELCRELFRLADTIDVCSTGDHVATLCVDTLMIQALGHRKVCCSLDLLPELVSASSVTKVQHPLRRCGDQMCRSAIHSKPIVTANGQLSITPELRLLLLRAFCESSLLSILPNEQSNLSKAASYNSALDRMHDNSNDDDEPERVSGHDGHNAGRAKIRFAVVRATHVRRLGDVCNELGKRFLARTTDSRADLSIRSVTAATAGDWLQEALDCFSAVGDHVNAALVRCNISTLCRLYGTNTVPRPSKMTLRDSVRGGNKARARDDHLQFDGEEYLTLALDVCFEAHEALENRELHPIAWDVVSQEAAMTYLAYGVAQRQACQGNVQSKDERRVIEPLQTALRIYEGLQNHRKAAAAHFHIGSFYSKLWSNVTTETRATAALRQALQHYSQAYQYYSSQDIGPTLVLIVTDMFDLYMATGECLKATEPTTSPEAHHLHAGSLQQAVSCILSIHNAFTPAVYQRYRKEMYKLARGVTKRLSRALLELLKSPAPSLLFLREPGDEQIAANLIDIKRAYKVLITDLRHPDNEQQLDEVDDQQAEVFVCRLGAFLAETREKQWSEDIAKAMGT